MTGGFAARLVNRLLPIALGPQRAGKKYSHSTENYPDPQPSAQSRVSGQAILHCREFLQQIRIQELEQAILLLQFSQPLRIELIRGLVSLRY